jgi:ABC-type multidrug transport system fused ATPase/permease subunit
VLLCDEATSALDTSSEAHIMQALGAVAQGRSTVMIAHRLSTVVNASKIIVLDQGRIAEQGRPPARPSPVGARPRARSARPA